MISIKDFDGEYPRTLPHLLPDNAAQLAVDCDFTTNILAGIRERGTTTAINSSNAKSIFVYDTLGGSWFSWPTDVDAIRGPIAADTFKRIYWSDGEFVYVGRGDIGSGGAPTQFYKAGCPRPPSALTVTSGASNGSAKFLTDATYSITAICEDSSRQVRSQKVLSPVVGVNTAMQLDLTLGLEGFSCKTETTTTVTTNSSSSQSANSTGAYSYGAYPASSTTSGSTQTGADTSTTAVSPATTLAFQVRCTDGNKIFSSVVRASAADSSVDPLWEGVSAFFTSAGTSVTLSFRRADEYLETRAYTWTLVNSYGEEGPPANPVEIECAVDARIALSIPEVTPSGFAPVSRVRVYRTSSGTAITDYLFAGDVPVGTVNFMDDNAAGDLGEPLPTRGYNPPEAGLQGLCQLPNGVLAAFKDNEVHFSEPYLPYAWKAAPITTDGRVVGICPGEGGLWVTTTKAPYFITGVTPDAMVQNKVTAIQAGVSKGSICNMGPAVIYASHDGLMTARGVEVSADWSFKFFTRDEWRARYGARLHLLHLNAHDGHLLGWFSDGAPGFLVRFDEADTSFTRTTDPVMAATVHPVADALYVVAGAVYEFKGGATRKPFVWRSKDFIMPKPMNFGAVQVGGEGGVTITVYADGVARATKKLLLSGDEYSVVRLPAGFLARRWAFEVAGGANAVVREVNVAISPSEFANV